MGHDVFRFLRRDAAALEIEQRVLVQLADGRAVIAHNVFLGAQDQRHRLVGDAVTQHQNRLLLVANGTCGAFLKSMVPRKIFLASCFSAPAAPISLLVFCPQ